MNTLTSQSAPSASAPTPAQMEGRLKVALVYPPFGPAGLPSLGIALLTAGVKARGHTCRAFYWNFDLIAHMPGTTLARQLDAYRSLSSPHWHPFNEWVFSGLVYRDILADRDREAQQESTRLNTLPGDLLRAADLLDLRERVGDLVTAMVDRLAPYDLIGIATTFYQNLPALALAKQIKERWPAKTVVLGGANCDGEMGAGLMRLFGFLDYVFSGEVDYAFPEFVDRLSRNEPLDGVVGLHRRGTDGAVIAGPRALPLRDLDALPFPDYDDYIAERQRFGIDAVHELVLALESSRGCWWGEKHHCTFCGLNALGIGYRQKSYERFREEVVYIAQRYGSRYLFMADNILSTSYYDQFMEWAAKANLQIDYFYEMKANVKRWHIERLANAGITGVQPGIESFSTKVLKLMNKGTTGIQNVALLKYAREYGILTTYNILFGFPGEEPEEYLRMADEIPKLVHLPPPTSLTKVEFHRFSPYHQRPAEFGLRLHPSSKYRYLYPFAEGDIAQIAYLFDRDGDEATDYSYLTTLFERVAHWHRIYSEDECALSWWSDLLDVLILDRRPGFPALHYRLKDYAAKVFRQLDSPKSLSRLIEEAQAVPPSSTTDQFLTLILDTELDPEPIYHSVDEVLIRFSAEQFACDPEACLAHLVRAGLLYVEVGDQHNPRYLALPVRKNRRATRLSWLKVGV